MKKPLAFVGLVALFIFLFFVPVATAHELYIQVDENPTSNELRVDILWGHIRDSVSDASPEDYQLFVRYPNGESEQLDLEAAGVHARAYVPITDLGDYTFWATREPGTYTPEDDVTQLSQHFAKIIHPVGQVSEIAEQPVESELEIIPNIDVVSFSTGPFKGTVLANGEGVANATISAFGPDHEILETTSDENGQFELAFASTGKWVVKANIKENSAGTLNGEDYELISRTTTLLLDTAQTETNDSNMWAYAAMFVIGLLIGASAVMFGLRKK